MSIPTPTQEVPKTPPPPSLKKNPKRNLPHIHLLLMEPKHRTAFLAALSKSIPSSSSTPRTAVPPPIPLTTHSTSLNQLPPTLHFDAIVSPANSYGRLDGAFDDAISRAFCLPDHSYDTLTRQAQRVLYERVRGFLPPGGCVLVPFPEELLHYATETEIENKKGRVEGEGKDKKDQDEEASKDKTPTSTSEHSELGGRWGCKWVALCPTMRTPDTARWDREVVYECVWSLLCAVEGWNRGFDDLLENQGGEGSTSIGAGTWAGEQHRRLGRIESILITPMATGCGGVSAEKWAAQFVLAMRDFVDAVERSERWERLGWGEIYEVTKDVEKTWRM
ncbi:hypothetical protein BJY04DRAFT_121263 [Aspergillus karnatakaensis]|uniref:uncharacterized protein n=1 Tax=Aspergillus karnatakaensis TaxID=1810916 RepID=UPI003CCDAC90